MIDQGIAKLRRDGLLPSLRSATDYLGQYGLFRPRMAYSVQKYRWLHGHHMGDPFGLIQVDPSNVNHYLSPRFGPQSAVFRIEGGT